MTFIDWVIIGVYLLGMIALSVYLSRGQSDQEDYFVAGRTLPWWAIGLSTMATQTGAISFISIPAFVALKPGGGLTWLQYEIAVPLAIIIVMLFMLPFFHKLKLISIYEYLELRYNKSVRYMVSSVFLLSRGLATGVGVYATAIVLSVCMEIPLWTTILIIGVVTIIYDAIGGIKAVVYSDVIQMFILLLGVVACIFYAADMAGGFKTVLTSLPPARMTALEPSLGINDNAAAPFWAFLVGGVFLYASYYGADQSQVQRELSAASTADTRKSLLFNGLARFPLTALYILMGMAIWAVYDRSPELKQAIEAQKPDYLVPRFILLYLPPGMRGLMFASILAAAMSSLDSALNSLSASTMHDFVRHRVKRTSHPLLLSKLTTVCWGLFITGFAFLVGSISDTVIESINKIGSAFYGPILAAFIVGILSKKSTAGGIILGILAGVGFNLTLWLTQPGTHWMWWNVFGFLVTALCSFLLSGIFGASGARQVERYRLDIRHIIAEERSWIVAYACLAAAFLLFLGIVILL